MSGLLTCLWAAIKEPHKYQSHFSPYVVRIRRSFFPSVHEWWIEIFLRQRNLRLVLISPLVEWSNPIISIFRHSFFLVLLLLYEVVSSIVCFEVNIVLLYLFGLLLSLWLNSPSTSVIRFSRQSESERPTPNDVVAVGPHFFRPLFHHPFWQSE